MNTDKVKIDVYPVGPPPEDGDNALNDKVPLLDKLFAFTKPKSLFEKVFVSYCIFHCMCCLAGSCTFSVFNKIYVAKLNEKAVVVVQEVKDHREQEMKLRIGYQDVIDGFPDPRVHCGEMHGDISFAQLRCYIIGTFEEPMGYDNHMTACEGYEAMLTYPKSKSELKFIFNLLRHHGVSTSGLKLFSGMEFNSTTGKYQSSDFKFEVEQGEAMYGNLPNGSDRKDHVVFGSGGFAEEDNSFTAEFFVCSRDFDIQFPGDLPLMNPSN